MGETFWDGERPLAERQTIEDYQAGTEPVIADLLGGLEGIGLGDTVLQGESSLIGCGTGDRTGFEVAGSGVKGAPVDPDQAAAVGDRVLGPRGLSHQSDLRDEDGMVTLTWSDIDDGGYVTVVVVPGSHTSVGYRSGCRPTDGSTTGPGRERPAWEQAIAPMEGDSPSPSETPGPAAGTGS